MDFFSNPNIHSVVTERVKCAFAPATKDGEYGTHYVVLMRDKNNHLLYVSCECEEEHGTALAAGMDTGDGDTCFSYVGALRRSISGQSSEQETRNLQHMDDYGNKTLLSRVVHRLNEKCSKVRRQRSRKTAPKVSWGRYFYDLSERTVNQAMVLSRAVERLTDTSGRYLVVPWSSEQLDTVVPNMSIPEEGHNPTYTVHTCRRGEFNSRPIMAFINNEWRLNTRYSMRTGLRYENTNNEWGVPFPKNHTEMCLEGLEFVLEDLATAKNSLTLSDSVSAAGGRCQVCRKDYDRIARHTGSSTHLADVFTHLTKITKLLGSTTQLRSLNKFGSAKLIKKRPDHTKKKNNRYLRPEYIRHADHFIVVRKKTEDSAPRDYSTYYYLSKQERSLLKMGLVNMATELYYQRTGFTEGEARALIEDYIKLTSEE